MASSSRLFDERCQCLHVGEIKKGVMQKYGNLEEIVHCGIYQILKTNYLPRIIRNKQFYSTRSAEDFVENVVKKKLTNVLQPEFIEVVNESARHNVPRGSASHIRVTIVSALFNGKKMIQRHRMVNDALQEELKGPIHALSIDAIAPTEIKEKIEKKESPPCRGGSGL